MAPTPIDGNRYATARAALNDKIRKVPDFPEEGVLFEDLTPVLADPAALNIVIAEMATASRKLGADLVGPVLGDGVPVGVVVPGVLDGLLAGAGRQVDVGGVHVEPHEVGQ